ncbi:MAG: tape measure protein [Burkholderiales bacterium]
MPDPKIKFDILATAEGTADVQRLTKELEHLDNAFDPSVSARAEKLTEDLRQLGAQSTAINGFNQVAKKADEAGFALARADDQVREFAESLQHTTTPTKAQAGEFQKLTDAAEKAKLEFASQGQALTQARAGLDKLGISTQTLAQRERDVVTAIAAAKAEVISLAAESQRTAAAGDRLAASWQSLGVRSFKDVQAESAKVRAALQEIQSVSRNPAEIKIATEAAQAKLRALGNEITGNVGGSIDGLATKFAKFGAIAAGIGFAARPLYELAVQTDTLKRSLTSVTGSAEAAQRQIKFLSDTAQQAGISVGDISDAYVRFTASANASGISIDVVNQVFASTASAAGNLGLGTEKVTRILDALGQMAGKGVVSMEELRQQLGDSLPGAVALLAKGLGLTQAELIKLVESGQLLSRDALPALGEAMLALGAKGAQVEGLSASFARLKNAVGDAGREIIDGPIGTGAGAALLGVDAVLRGLLATLVVFNEGFRIAGRSIALLVAALTGNIGSFKLFKDEFGAIFEESGKKIDDFNARTLNTGAAAKAAGAAAAAAGQDVAKGSQSYVEAAAATTQAAQAHTQAGTAAVASAQAHAGLASTTTAAAAAATVARPSWAKLTVDYANVTAELERQVKISEKVVTAKKIEGEAAVAVTKISGDAFAALQVESSAAENNARAHATLAEKRQTEVNVLKAQLDAEVALARQLGDADGARQKQIDAVQKLLETKTAETEATKAQAAAAKTEANARSLAVKAYADNSAALGELKAAYDYAAGAVGVMRLEQKQGLATQEDVNASLARAAAAEHLYRDALADSAAATTRKNAITAASNNVNQAAINLEIARARATEAAAVAVGNESVALEAKILQKQLEIKSIEAGVAATIKQSDATLADLELQRQAIAANDPLLVQKQQEIELRVKNVQATKLEAEAKRAAIPAIQAETEALQRRNSAAAGSLGGSSAGRNSDVKSVLGTNTYDKNGLAQDSSGNTLTLSGQANVGDDEYFDKAAYDREAAASARSGRPWYVDPQRFVHKKTGNPAGVTNTPTGSGSPAPGLSLTSKPTPNATPSAAPAPGLQNKGGASAYTVNVNLAGRSTPIGVASPSDANALVSLVQRLATEANRAAP